jgi:hypothetical protein
LGLSDVYPYEVGGVIVSEDRSPRAAGVRAFLVVLAAVEIFGLVLVAKATLVRAVPGGCTPMVEDGCDTSPLGLLLYFGPVFMLLQLVLLPVGAVVGSVTGLAVGLVRATARDPNARPQT